MRERAGMDTTDSEDTPAVRASMNGSSDSSVPALVPAGADSEAGAPGGPEADAAKPAATTSRPTAGSLEAPARQPAKGPVDWVMSELIRKLAWSRLSQPKVAISVSAFGLLLGMLVCATAPNTETLKVQLPLSTILPSLAHQSVLASVVLYTGNILACLGLAGMLWAHSQGWRPNPRHLLLASAAVVAVMVSLTPVGSSDTASYAAYGRIAARGGNPYTTNPLHFLGVNSVYTQAVGDKW